MCAFECERAHSIIFFAGVHMHVACACWDGRGGEHLYTDV